MAFHLRPAPDTPGLRRPFQAPRAPPERRPGQREVVGKEGVKNQGRSEQNYQFPILFALLPARQSIRTSHISRPRTRLHVIQVTLVPHQRAALHIRLVVLQQQIIKLLVVPEPG
jgi:hypothetical protein